MSLMTTISIGTTALFTFGSAISVFAVFMSVPTGGARPRITYITRRERSTLWDMKGMRSLERFMFGITACHCGTLPWSFVWALFSGYGRSLSDSLCFVVLFLYILYFLFFSLGGDGPGVENKILWHGACNQVPGTATTTTNYCGILAFSSGGCFFSFLGFVGKRRERQAVWNWNYWLCYSGMAGLYVCVSTFLVR